MPILQHYVTIARRRVEVVRYDRARDWKPTAILSLKRSLDLPALGSASLPLAAIYRWTPIGV